MNFENSFADIFLIFFNSLIVAKLIMLMDLIEVRRSHLSSQNLGEF